MLGLANAWCRKLEEEEMKEEKERRKRKRTKKRMKRMKCRTKRTKRTNKRKRRGGGGGGGGGESVENLVRGDSFKAKAEAKPKQSKIHKTRRQAGGFSWSSGTLHQTITYHKDKWKTNWLFGCFGQGPTEYHIFFHCFARFPSYIATGLLLVILSARSSS